MVIDIEKLVKDFKRMCDTIHSSGGTCDICPLVDITPCLSIDNLEEIAPIVVKWAKEQPENTSLDDAKSARTNNAVKFILNGCDISFVAEAPADMTVKQLVEQANRIKPNWCACGICKADESDEVEIIFDYNDVYRVGEDISCTIKEN